ncbi:cobyrinic acid a,c-diamide reductase [Natrinema pellirubrum DSM 15624]|uniref:Cob(II)yrinic acid a,c-diamide reductase n=1 Tax=Natrinema pellirubrum (strain DSM 15624 / CIP 106293 / JCM 10476 / NCIMB 786 / 157) TaxID=797303 RepID=L0JL08_NATP1|nr:5,6-dimethylbenzimidazole synthase [Natrinema pellirubrum]AGB31528.1 cob(II)yrinic acid a,c-diamide reductase [Natrinema pellirubrum DSM 15624]ELY73318.1 cobyrinic acid a,c-diamide reductase [Natrinema pellirubrum DSM 15624]
MVAFSDAERDAVYKAIFTRRDIRRFRDDPIPDGVLERLLEAAHHAPSVGFSQPWDLVVVRETETKAEIAEIADRAIAAAREGYKEPRRSEFAELKLEGIRESPVNVCVTCDPTRGAPHVLGRSSMRRTDVYSTCLAVQNLWLAARAEGIGVGWVSVLYPHEVREALDIPAHVKPIAYLCLGYPEDGFPDEPVLQQEGWRERLDVETLVHEGGWNPDRATNAAREHGTDSDRGHEPRSRSEPQPR